MSADPVSAPGDTGICWLIPHASSAPAGCSGTGTGPVHDLRRPHHDRQIRPLPPAPHRPSTSSTPDQGRTHPGSSGASFSRGQASRPPPVCIRMLQRPSRNLASRRSRVEPPEDQRGTAAKTSPAVGYQPRGPSREPALEAGVKSLNDRLHDPPKASARPTGIPQVRVPGRPHEIPTDTTTLRGIPRNSC